MKRILTIICAIAFSGVALSAQNNADTIRVNRNGTDNLVIIVKEKGMRTFANPSIGLDIARFSMKVGYEYQLGF